MQDLVDICHKDIRAATHTALDEIVRAVSDCKHAMEASASKLNNALADATMKFDMAAELRLAAFRGESTGEPTQGSINEPTQGKEEKKPEKPAEAEKQKMVPSWDEKSSEQTTTGDENGLRN